MLICHIVTSSNFVHIIFSAMICLPSATKSCARREGWLQLASVTLTVAEELFCPCITLVPLDTTGHHPSDLPLHLARFRDNIIGLKHAGTPLLAIQSNLQDMYALNLQVESEGTALHLKHAGATGSYVEGHN